MKERHYRPWIEESENVNPFIEELYGFPLAYAIYDAAKRFCMDCAYEHPSGLPDNYYPSEKEVYHAIKNEKDAIFWNESEDEYCPFAGYARYYMCCDFRFHLHGKEFVSGSCIRIN